MKRRFKLLLGVGIFVGYFGACFVMTSAQEPTPSSPEASGTDRNRLRVRYAEASVELAQIEVQLRQEANRRTPNTYTPSQLEHCEANVQLAKEQLRLAQQPASADADFVSVYLLQAENRARNARQTYTDALESNRLDPAYSALKLRRLELEAERSQLRLAMWQDPSNTLLEHIHWELDRVSEELLALEQKVDRLISQIGQGGE